MTTLSGETLFWNGELRSQVLGSDQPATALAFSSDRTLLAIGRDDRTIVIWDIKHSQVQHRLVGHTQLVSSIAFCREGQTLVSGAGSTALFSSGEVKLWNLATGQAHATLPGYGGPVAVDSADGILAVTDHSGRSVAIWSRRELPGDAVSRVKASDECCGEKIVRFVRVIHEWARGREGERSRGISIASAFTPSPSHPLSLS